jgi:hypothetical protein
VAGIGSVVMSAQAAVAEPGPATRPPATRPRGGEDRRAVGTGLAGVLLAFVVLAGLHALTVPPFLPADERSHTGYGLVVGRGELPTLTTPAPLLAPPGVGPRIYTANHPPLYYALVAAPLRLGVATGHPMAGFAAARLLTVLAAAAGVAAVAALALVLCPDRPRLALAATVAAPLLPSFVHLSGLVHNDALGFTTATAAMAATALVLVRGPSAGRLAVLATAAAAAPLTRASGLPFAALAVLAAGLAPLLHGRGRPALARVRAAAAQAGLAAGATLGAAGWFYLRNRALYGDLGGTAENLRLFGFDQRRPLLGVLGSGGFWSGVHDQLWGRMGGGQFLATGPLALPGRLLGAAVVAGLVLAGVRAAHAASTPPTPRPVGPRTGRVADGGIRGARLSTAPAGPLRPRPPAGPLRPRPPAGLRRPGRPAGLPRPGRPAGATGRLVAGALTLAMVPLTMLAMAFYVAEGGGTHARYLYPALGAIGLAAGAGLAALPGRGRADPVLAVFAAMTAVNLLLWATFLSRTAEGRPSLAAAVGRAGWAASGPATVLVVAVAAVLLAVAVALVARAVALLDVGPATAAAAAAPTAVPEPARGGP